MHSAVAHDLLATAKRSKLSKEALAGLEEWLQDPEYAEFVPEIGALIERGDWNEIEDSFYQHVNIGTGGIRGQIGVGPNRINMRTIGEAAQALCQFIAIEAGEDGRDRGVVVGHEARRFSRDFATMCCEVFAENGIKSYLFEDIRSTPEVSFAVRHLKAIAGVQITASHNPRTDNGFKFYWTSGGQVVPPLDLRFMELVKNVKGIKRKPLQEVLGTKVEIIGREVDEAYWQNVLSLSLEPSRSARIAFGAIHGAGKTNVLPVLRGASFEVLPYLDQLEPNADFPQAAGNLINPEFEEVVHKAGEFARSVNADVAVCSDPDADRAGILAKTDLQRPDLKLLRGDDVAAVLTHFILSHRREQGRSAPNDLVLETRVTTKLMSDIARGFGVECIDDLKVGFKWMAEIIDQREKDLGFVFAAEESIGYLAGTFVRDKDAAIAALFVSELASWLKDRNKTIFAYLDDLYREYGCYRNLQQLRELPGKQGMEVMRQVMLGLRSSPPTTLGGRQARMEDVLRAEAPEVPRTEPNYKLGHAADMLTFHLSDDGRDKITVRPSGTEPKLKYYVQLYRPVSGDLEALKAEMRQAAIDLSDELVAISGERVHTAQSDAASADVLRQHWQEGIRRLI